MIYLGDQPVGISMKPINIGQGSFTPSEDVISYTIDTGKNFSVFIVQLKDLVLVSGKRNFQYLIVVFDTNDTLIKYYSVTSNAAGTSWGSVGVWYKGGSLVPAEKNGNSITVTINSIASGATFFANTEYEWYCW